MGFPIASEAVSSPPIQKMLPLAETIVAWPRKRYRPGLSTLGGSMSKWQQSSVSKMANISAMHAYIRECLVVYAVAISTSVNIAAHKAQAGDEGKKQTPEGSMMMPSFEGYTTKRAER